MNAATTQPNDNTSPSHYPNPAPKESFESRESNDEISSLLADQAENSASSPVSKRHHKIPAFHATQLVEHQHSSHNGSFLQREATQRNETHNTIHTEQSQRMVRRPYSSLHAQHNGAEEPEGGRMYHHFKISQRDQTAASHTQHNPGNKLKRGYEHSSSSTIRGHSHATEGIAASQMQNSYLLGVRIPTGDSGPMSGDALFDYHSDTIPTDERPKGGIDIKVLGLRKTRKEPQKWTPEEDEKLREAVLLYKASHWKLIAEHLENRNYVQCMHRWQKVLAPELVKGPWTKEEDNTLLMLVHQHGTKSWANLAEGLPGRTAKQIRERWLNHLTPGIRKDNWTAEEDRLIVSGIKKYGKSWADIAKHLPGRPYNSIKNRWNCTLHKIFANEVEGTEHGLGFEDTEGEVDLDAEADSFRTQQIRFTSQPIMSSRANPR